MLDNKIILTNIYDFLSNDEGFNDYLEEENLLYLIEPNQEDYFADSEEDEPIFKKIGRFFISIIKPNI